MSRRVSKKYLGAFKPGHRPQTKEFIDEDLAEKLLARIEANPDDKEAIEALEFLTKFNNEYYRNWFGEEPLHDSKESRKRVYSRANANNRDLVSMQRAERTHDYELERASASTSEDDLIEAITQKRSGKNED